MMLKNCEEYMAYFVRMCFDWATSVWAPPPMDERSMDGMGWGNNFLLDCTSKANYGG
jgi:hypothetical protein